MPGFVVVGGATGATVSGGVVVGVLVVPFCVVLAWAMGRPLDLNFNEFEGLVLFISVLLAAVVLQVGRGCLGGAGVGWLHWLLTR